MANPPKAKTFELATTAQVRRVYTVGADNEAQARERLRQHFKDPAMLREGIVAEVPEKQMDSTPQRIVAIDGRAVKDAVPTVPRVAAGQESLPEGEGSDA